MRTRKQTVIALEREVAREIARASRAEADRERLVHALDAFDGGVVVVDESGTEVLRNPAAERFRAGRHGAALAEEGLAELLEQARSGCRPGARAAAVRPAPRGVAARAACR